PRAGLRDRGGDPRPEVHPVPRPPGLRAQRGLVLPPGLERRRQPGQRPGGGGAAPRLPPAGPGGGRAAPDRGSDLHLAVGPGARGPAPARAPRGRGGGPGSPGSGPGDPHAECRPSPRPGGSPGRSLGVGGQRSGLGARLGGRPDGGAPGGIRSGPSARSPLLRRGPDGPTLAHCRTLSIVIETPRAPTATPLTVPSRSPLPGMASPVRETRAVMSNGPLKVVPSIIWSAAEIWKEWGNRNSCSRLTATTALVLAFRAIT